MGREGCWVMSGDVKGDEMVYKDDGEKKNVTLEKKKYFFYIKK